MPLYFGVFVSLFAYLIGMELKKKFGWPVLNPLLVAIILVIAFLKATGITYTDYNEGASYISYFLTPATVCLAIPLYKQLELLKRNLTAVATAITAGVIGSVVSVYVMSMIFKLEHVHYVSLLPKSITTAIGMGVSEEAGGIVTMTIVSIIITEFLEISLRTAGSSSSESRSRSRRPGTGNIRPCYWNSKGPGAW
mgnify:CR=1 FL=1